MKGVEWRVVAPIVLLGVLLGWLAVWRTAQSPGTPAPWINGLPILVVGFTLMGLAAWLRRRKSGRTWALMLHSDPHASHFIAFVYPTVKSQLGRLGWQLHGSAYASIPAIGVSIGTTAVKFWEAGTAGPTLILATSDIKSATVGQVTDGYRSHPAIELRFNTANRSNQLQLNLRDTHHRNLSFAEINEAVETLRALSPSSQSHDESLQKRLVRGMVRRVGSNHPEGGPPDHVGGFEDEWMGVMKPQLHWTIAVLILITHGLLMWVVVPFAVIAWVFVHNWLQKADLEECLGWYDLNLVAFLQRVLFRPIIREPSVSWIPVRRMTEVTHRVSLFDFL